MMMPNKPIDLFPVKLNDEKQRLIRREKSEETPVAYSATPRSRWRQKVEEVKSGSSVYHFRL